MAPVSSALFILLCSLPVGVLVGAISGLLGIGGGLVLVPVFYLLLPLAGVQPDNLMTMSLASSLAAVIITSLSSCLAHARLGNVPWQNIPLLLSGLASGALMAGYLAALIPAWFLELAFALFAGAMSIRMWLDQRQAKSEQSKPYRKFHVLVATTVIGGVSALLGIAGGTLLVPYLSSHGMIMKRAIGASACCGIIVAAAGTLGYISSGLQVSHLPEFSIGYVYLPAVLGIAITALFSAPLGAKLASRWPTRRLKKIVAIMLLLVAVKLLLF
ncbi:sulfite exporter TauE/SafE family protein [Corallincola spongiicola]|uniref:Probable membrane transporter protein n=1 Tax=Corallincola spongiicola TaxID=2520508 RepID=A0ABY1WLX3_9GAMM|nr:sulfite exporter TauE/SafE family protein [Corallincola spongiicola]